MTESLLVKHFDDLLSTSEDAEQLSNTILQLAMQGKLGTQDSSDEPASEILKKIRSSRPDSEKELSVREDEIPFPLPNGWEWVRLPEVTDNWGQKKPDKQFTYIDVSSIDNQFGVVSDELAILNPDDAPSRARKIVKEGSVIYSTVRPYLLNIAIIDRDIQPEPIVSTAFYVMHPVEGLDVRFLYLYLRSKYFTKFVESQMTGMAYPAISDGKMSLGVIPLPPYAEQQRIVTRVEELFARTRALAKELDHSQIELDGLNKSALSHLLASETPEEFNQHWEFIAEHFDLLFQAPEHVAPLRQSILELAVRGKLTRREAGDESAKELLEQISEQKKKPIHPIKDNELQFELPDSWVWTSLDDISRLITDGTHVTPSYLYDGVPFLSVKDVSKGYLDFSSTRFISEEEHKKLSARCKPELGDVLLTKVGTTGIALIVDTDREFSIFVSIALLKIYQNEVLPDYLSLVINSPFVKRQSDKYTMGVGNKNLVLKHIKNFLIPLPPLAEQERIVKRVEQLLSLCDALEARLLSAEEERGRLVRAVMAGVGG